jgi:hypothetical protein
MINSSANPRDAALYRFPDITEQQSFRPVAPSWVVLFLIEWKWLCYDPQQAKAELL